MSWLLNCSECAPGTYWTRGWTGPTAHPDVLKKRFNTCPFQEQSNNSSDVQSIAQSINWDIPAPQKYHMLYAKIHYLRRVVVKTCGDNCSGNEYGSNVTDKRGDTIRDSTSLGCTSGSKVTARSLILADDGGSGFLTKSNAHLPQYTTSHCSRISNKTPDLTYFWCSYLHDTTDWSNIDNCTTLQLSEGNSHSSVNSKL
jgi:hypothetical protein